MTTKRVWVRALVAVTAAAATAGAPLAASATPSGSERGSSVEAGAARAASPAVGYQGKVTMATANIRVGLPYKKFQVALRAASAKSPDFLTLNEMRTRSRSQVRATLGKSRYGAIRPKAAAKRDNQELQTMVAFRKDRWKKIDSGRFQFVKNDHTWFNGRKVNWNRYAVWGRFQNKKTGQEISVIAAHHMTNPAKFPRQWGKVKMSRVKQYKAGMKTILGVVTQLAPNGPVLVGGDMNSRQDQAGKKWSAGYQMRKAGYSWQATGVDFVFYPANAQNVKRLFGDMPHADHDWVGARFTLP